MAVEHWDKNDAVFLNSLTPSSNTWVGVPVACTKPISAALFHFDNAEAPFALKNISVSGTVSRSTVAPLTDVGMLPAVARMSAAQEL